MGVPTNVLNLLVAILEENGITIDDGVARLSPAYRQAAWYKGKLEHMLAPTFTLHLAKVSVIK